MLRSGVRTAAGGRPGGVIAIYLHSSAVSTTTTVPTGTQSASQSSTSSEPLITVPAVIKTPTATTTLTGVTLTLAPFANPTVVVVDPVSHLPIEFSEQNIPDGERSLLPTVTGVRRWPSSSSLIRGYLHPI